jgi:hypothetical protein
MAAWLFWTMINAKQPGGFLLEDGEMDEKAKDQESESEWTYDCPSFADIPEHIPNTKIKLDSFEKIGAVWTFELDDGFDGTGEFTNRWYPIPKNPQKFIGLLLHISRKNWCGTEDISELIEWAAEKYKWKIYN